MYNTRFVKFCLLALAGAFIISSTQAQTFTPIPLTPGSFTQEIVVPADWKNHLNNQAVTVTIDHGPALQTNISVAGFPNYYSVLSGNTFFEIGMERTTATTLTYGLPHANSLLTNTTFNSHVYLLGNWNNFNSNVLCICPYTNGGTYNGQPLTAGPYIGQNYNTNVNLTLNNTTNFTALSLLTSGGGPFTNSVTISYADGTTQGPVFFVIPNWFVNSNTYIPSGGNIYPNCGFAYTAQSRANPSVNNNQFFNNQGVASGTRLWSIDIALNNSTSPVTNLSFSPLYTNNAAGTVPAEFIFAVSGSVNPGDNAAIPNTNVLTGPFSPISVSGYNAGGVVPNSPLSLAGLAPLTATMDNGTSLTANTWFEQGFDQAAPTNGFPVHNTILTSLANPSRTYQMPASYHQAMSVLIDKNHTLANITPQTPGSYSGFSLLTAGASIGTGKQMTNSIVLQHSDGVNETNIFIGFDWFESVVPPAWSAYERVNVGTTTSSNGILVQNLENAGGPPHLFDSTFQMQDGSPVTNIQVGFLTAPAANSTTYVIAVSATTNFIPVQVNTNTVAQNLYAGGTATFNVNLAFGTLPTYQWQFVSGGVTNNLANGSTGTGSTISGATTHTLTVANVSASDVGFYTCFIANAAPSSANSTLAPLTLLTSTASNLVAATDPITDFGDTSPSPPGQDVTKVIDNTSTKYLNFGANGSNGSPFQGPVGFVVTPQIGDSVITAMRFFNANDNPLRDPVDYELDGSTDGGNTYTTISSGSLSLFDLRNPNGVPINVTNLLEQEVDFPNTSGYNTYKVTFQHNKDNLGANTNVNSLQIGEIQLLGTLAQVAPGILVQPIASRTVFVGANATMSVVGNGPQPITYQWYYNTNTMILGATNATFVLTNAQLTDAGAYNVVLSNAYGSTPSSNLTLNVISPPNNYVSTIVNDHPIAYWRLDEGPDNGNGDNGVIANDYAGGHDGIYTNVTLGVTGYSQFDTNTAVSVENFTAGPSYVGQINGINFATPTNTSGNLSVEAWVNGNGIITKIGGAGLVTLGYGGGGEEFALDCGATSNNFRFYFRDAGGAAHNANDPNAAAAPQPSVDGTWHHLVGVVNESATNQVLYVDGLPVASNNLAAGLGILQPNPQFPLEIGARSQATTNPIPNLQFQGSIDEVAIYNYALTPAQVQNHYFIAGIVPRITKQPVNVTVPEGTTATFTSGTYGSTPLTNQWWNSDGSNPTTPITGQTNNTLTFPNVSGGQTGAFYQFVGLNSYGGVTSAPAQLTVISGPPIIQTDIPSSIIAYADSPLTLKVVVSGTPPFTYQWQHNGTNISDGGRFSGTSSNVLTVNPILLGDAGDMYQVFISNSQSGGNPTPSTVANIIAVLPRLTLNGFGSEWAINGHATYPQTNLLQFTDGTGNEASSSFFSSPVYIGSGFQASWTYQDVGGGGADGYAFVIHNDSRGAAALGGGGGSLGVSGITPSAEVEFNIYSPNIPGYFFDINGAVPVAPTKFNPTGALGIDSGDPINVTVTSQNGQVSLSLADPVANTSFSTSVSANIPAIVGGNTAYVGFTGADGGTASTQTVSNFTFISFSGLSVTPVAGNNLVVTWPAGSGGYTLQQTASLAPASWSTVPNQPVSAGGFNQVVLPAPVGSVYFRLNNP